MKLILPAEKFGSDIDPEKKLEFGENGKSIDGPETGSEAVEGQNKAENGQPDLGRENIDKQPASTAENGQPVNIETGEASISAPETGDAEKLGAQGLTEENLEHTIVNTEITPETAHDMVQELEELNTLLKNAQETKQ